MARNKRFFKNEQIRAKQLLVINEQGKRLGEMSKEEALAKAKEQNKDLVLISFQTNPPISKIIDFGKFLYQQKKKSKKQKAKELKKIRISFNISDHDLETKKKQIREFLFKKHHVRLCMILRGRENIYKRESIQKMKQIADSLGVKIEIPVKIEGSIVSVQFAP